MVTTAKPVQGGNGKEGIHNGKRKERKKCGLDRYRESSLRITMLLVAGNMLVVCRTGTKNTAGSFDKARVVMLSREGR